MSSTEWSMEDAHPVPWPFFLRNALFLLNVGILATFIPISRSAANITLCGKSPREWTTTRRPRKCEVGLRIMV
jgi:hypothetical protein